MHIVVVSESFGSQDDDKNASFKPAANVATAEQVKATETANSSSPPCGKTCSYDWDSKEEGKYYPLLHKTVNCLNTLYRMAHSPYTVVKPPPKRPPPELVRNYTIDGQCPISAYVYSDDTISGPKPPKLRYNPEEFRNFLQRDNVSNINSYQDRNALKPALHKYVRLIREKRVAVIGTAIPWAEAMLVNLGANSVTTVEYSDIVIEHERVSTITPYRVAEQFINGQAVPFDTVFTYSSLEHSGMGRYGDPIAPFGDLEATAQIWCMVKPGGHLILALPVSSDRKQCSIVWNLDRIYGAVRLQHLTANWRVLDEFMTYDLVNQRLFVLEKVQDV